VYNQGMNDIYSLSYELKDILSQDERVLLLNKLEEEMNTNEEVMKLAYQKDVAVSNYSDTLNHFDENSKEAKEAHHQMFLAKEALDNHPLVRKYLKAYQEVRDLYFEINDILFSNLSLKLREHK
jgi:cell fate (sporulation/competence/biofilm development) regulator YlbF (YheA/YmcA/DUF963 family)